VRSCLPCLSRSMDFEQRVNIKFCFKLKKNAKEAHEMLKSVYGDNVVTLKTVYKWYERFKSGNESVEDEQRSGRPSTSKTDENVQKVSKLIRSNRRLTIRELTEELNISYGSVQSILTDNLQMRRVSAKFVPRLLTGEQKENRVSVCTELKDRLDAHPDFMAKIITGDESWVYGYDPETKIQSSQWKTSASPRPKKARQSKSNVKVMLIVFFDSEGIVRSEFVPRGTTVNSEYYKGVLQRLRNDVRRKRPEKWANGFLLHHDNAPCHTSLLIREFLAEKKVPVCPHPPYSPDLAPCDFWLFPKIKSVLKGKRFDTISDIERATTEQLKTLPKEAFQKCFQSWNQRWDKCITSQGEYFEGD
jgi:[histone H3]-lysine36 N-dimethyltransferase SETMAR